jgi:predicted esterase
MQTSSPPSYYLVDTESGSSQRLLGSQSGLSIIGGENADAYVYREFDIASIDDIAVSGFISVPEVAATAVRPLVVVLPGWSDLRKWEKEFDEEIWFLNRQGFNVLLVNSQGADSVENIEAAIRWSIDSEWTDVERICLYGRGAGARMALRLVFHSDDYHCVISMGGDFSAAASMDTADVSNQPAMPDLRVLLIYGVDEHQSRAAGREFMQQRLRGREAEVYELSVAGEKSPFTVRQNEIDAFTRLAIFLQRAIGNEEDWPTLPLTRDQSIAMNELLEAFAARIETGFFNLRNWRRWFNSKDKALQELLSDEQIVLYEKFRDELIAMRRDPDWQNVNRPMRPIPGI